MLQHGGTHVRPLAEKSGYDDKLIKIWMLIVFFFSSRGFSPESFKIQQIWMRINQVMDHSSVEKGHHFYKSTLLLLDLAA